MRSLGLLLMAVGTGLLLAIREELRIIRRKRSLRTRAYSVVGYRGVRG